MRPAKAPGGRGALAQGRGRSVPLPHCRASGIDGAIGFLTRCPGSTRPGSPAGSDLNAPAGLAGTLQEGTAPRWPASHPRSLGHAARAAGRGLVAAGSAPSVGGRRAVARRAADPGGPRVLERDLDARRGSLLVRQPRDDQRRSAGHRPGGSASRAPAAPPLGRRRRSAPALVDGIRQIGDAQPAGPPADYRADVAHSPPANSRSSRPRWRSAARCG